MPRTTQSKGSVSQGGGRVLGCGRCCKNQVCKSRDVQSGLFKCGQEGYLMKECPKNK